MTKKKAPDPFVIDKDNPEWTDKMIAKAKPASEIFTVEQLDGLKRLRGQRGKQKAPVKVPVKLRVDRETLSSFRAMGRGWQTRMNDALRDYIINHKR